MRTFDEVANMLGPLDRPEALARPDNAGGRPRGAYFTSPEHANADDRMEDDPSYFEEDENEGAEEESLVDDEGNAVMYLEDWQYSEAEANYIQAYRSAYRDVRKELQRRRNERGYTKRGYTKRGYTKRGYTKRDNYNRPFGGKRTFQKGKWRENGASIPHFISDLFYGVGVASTSRRQSFCASFLIGGRLPMIVPADCTGLSEITIDDDWQAQHAHRELQQPWHGSVTFYQSISAHTFFGGDASAPDGDDFDATWRWWTQH